MTHDEILQYMRDVWEPYALVRVRDKRLVDRVTDMSLPEFEALVTEKGVDFTGYQIGPAFLQDKKDLTADFKDRLVACRVTQTNIVD